MITVNRSLRHYSSIATIAITQQLLVDLNNRKEISYSDHDGEPKLMAEMVVTKSKQKPQCIAIFEDFKKNRELIYLLRSIKLTGEKKRIKIDKIINECMASKLDAAAINHFYWK